MIVADTNLVVYLFNPSALTPVVEQVYRKDSHWVAPGLWRSEYRNAVAILMRRGLLTLDEAVEKIALAEAVMAQQDFDIVSARILRLAADSGCTAYDCEFVALAQDLKVPLVTSDKEVLTKFKGIAISPQAFCAGRAA
jgi:predicted nucleic acid-binding protein